MAAQLANRVGGSDGTSYLNVAKKEWAWFNASGLINSDHLVNDGLLSTCQNNGETPWTYNQGVIVGALAELHRADNPKNSTTSPYLDAAKKIADATISKLTENGILRESCEPNCERDESQFKGVFARNLRLLYHQIFDEKYRDFLVNNANSVWAKDRNGTVFGQSWTGPFIPSINATTQTSGLDVIVAALAAV